MKTYFLHGSAGDLLYALPAIEKLSGKSRIVNSMPYELHASLKPLLDSQGHELCHLSETELPAGTISLEQFSRMNRFHNGHLAKTFAKVLNVEVDISKPWLKVEPNKDIEGYSIINKTKRYNDKLCRWRKEYQWLKDNSKGVLFIGHVNEYCEFLDDYKLAIWNIGYLETRNHLEAARYIAGCKYFSGTQSSMLAICEGLGRSYRYERSPNSDNTYTGRTNETIINPLSRKLHYLGARLKEVARFYNI